MKVRAGGVEIEIERHGDHVHASSPDGNGGQFCTIKSDDGFIGFHHHEAEGAVHHGRPAHTYVWTGDGGMYCTMHEGLCQMEDGGTH
jgi:hypothetical protein